MRARSARGVRPDCAPRQSSSDTRCRLAPAVHLELLQNIVNVVLHSGHLDPQPLRDLLVREALVDEPHDLALTLTTLAPGAITVTRWMAARLSAMAMSIRTRSGASWASGASEPSPVAAVATTLILGCRSKTRARPSR